MTTPQHRSESASKAATGIPGLDYLLRGGLPVHRIHLVEGHPGAGKTTVGIQFLLEGLRHGESCMYITLSETEDELRANAASHDYWDPEKAKVVRPNCVLPRFTLVAARRFEPR